jgi:hypothetical protein
MIKINVEKEPLNKYEPLSEYENFEGLRYSATAEFKTAVEECSDPRSVINAVFDAMRLEGYTDYGIIKTMSEFVDENAEILYAVDGYPYPLEDEEDEDEEEEDEDTLPEIDELIQNILDNLFEPKEHEKEKV